MTVPSDYRQLSALYRKSGSGQDLVKNKGYKLGGIDDDSASDVCIGRLSSVKSDTSQLSTRKISEVWKSSTVNQDVDLARRYRDHHRRPCMSFDRLKAESVTLLATKIGLVSDSDVYNTIEMLLFLVREAELHKKMVHADYTNLKKVFERDEAIVRDILTEYNVPTTITESFFDTYIKSGGISDESIEETQAVLPSNTDDVDVSSPLASTITTQQQYPHAIGTPPINVAIPPPNAPAFRGVPNIPLPDLTQPPPVISNVTLATHSWAPFSGSSPLPQVNSTVPSSYSSIPHGFSNQLLHLPPVTTVPLPSLGPCTAFQHGGSFVSTNDETSAATNTFRRPEGHYAFSSESVNSVIGVKGTLK